MCILKIDFSSLYIRFECDLAPVTSTLKFLRQSGSSPTRVKPPKPGLREPLVAPRTTGVGTAATPPALASFEPPELARERVVLSADAQAARIPAGGCSGSSERGEGTGGAGRCDARQRRRCAPPAPAPFPAPAPRAQI